MSTPAEEQDADTRARQGIGDLSGVEIHTGEEAAQIALVSRAKAVTIGSSIYFGSGRFDPASEDDVALLAHELAHVEQQREKGEVFAGRAPTDPQPPSPAEHARLQAAAHLQLAGAERLEGSYLFTIERSVRAYRLNRFLHGLILPQARAAFLADPEAAFERAGLTPQERDLVRQRDWQGLIRYGAIFFVLEKLGAVIGVSNLHIYAAMRGESLEDFQRTRNAPGALYSVAGKDTGPLAWDPPREA